jgi:hypothetical protein
MSTRTMSRFAPLRDARPKARIPRSNPERIGHHTGLHCDDGGRRARLLERVILRGYSRDHEARRTILLRRWQDAS